MCFECHFDTWSTDESFMYLDNKQHEKVNIQGSVFIVSKVMENLIEEVILVLNDK